jgi:hypothetical protein
MLRNAIEWPGRVLGGMQIRQGPFERQATDQASTEPAQGRLCIVDWRAVLFLKWQFRLSKHTFSAKLLDGTQFTPGNLESSVCC